MGYIVLFNEKSTLFSYVNKIIKLFVRCEIKLVNVGSELYKGSKENMTINQGTVYKFDLGLLNGASDKC